MPITGVDDGGGDIRSYRAIFSSHASLASLVITLVSTYMQCHQFYLRIRFFVSRWRLRDPGGSITATTYGSAQVRVSTGVLKVAVRVHPALSLIVGVGKGLKARPWR